MLDKYLSLLSGFFHEGRWIDGRAYVVCKECGAFIPMDNDTIHFDWHEELNKIKRHANEIR